LSRFFHGKGHQNAPHSFFLPAFKIESGCLNGEKALLHFPPYSAKLTNMDISSHTYKHQQGFTLIEIIAVLIILGIVAVIAASRLSAPGDLMPEADVLKSHLRFAQLKALGDDVAGSWGIVFENGGYTLYKDSSRAAISLPGEDSNHRNFASGVTTSATAVNFDKWGSPGSNRATIALSQNGETTVITAAAGTGFITP
jgi:MSHA pilin protein MshC